MSRESELNEQRERDNFIINHYHKDNKALREENESLKEEIKKLRAELESYKKG
jgi:cell division protein FtsB